MARNQFTFYRSFRECIDGMKTKNERLQAYDLLTDYALYKKSPDLNALKPSVAMLFTIVKPVLDIAHRRSQEALQTLHPQLVAADTCEDTPH